MDDKQRVGIKRIWLDTYRENIRVTLLQCACVAFHHSTLVKKLLHNKKLDGD